VWQDGEALERAKVLAQRDLHRATGWLTTHRTDLRITHLIEVGDPATEILRVAERVKAGVIVLASAGHAGVGRLATGTVAERVTRHAEQPVLLIRLTDTMIGVPPPPLTRLVVPLDGSDLAAQALPVARELASRLQLPVHLITVIDPEEIGAPVVAYEATISPEMWQELFASARLDAQVRLERLCASLNTAGITTDWEIVEGRVAQAILERCRPGDLLVMTTRGRSGARLWRIGSIADKIIRYTVVPVLVLPVHEVRETIVPVVEELPAWPHPGEDRG
jgi:nucleotide-binding universal stress UspA family protein